MRFDAYQSRGQLGTPNANISNTHISDPGAMALAKAQGGFGTALVGGIMKISDKIDTTKALEANNEYNRLMSEGTAELMQNKEEMALDNVEKYDKLQKDVMQQVQKKYGGYIRYGAGAQAFNEFTMRDNNARRANMVRYQMGELEKYETTQFNNGLETCTNQSIAEGSTLEAIDGGINRTIALVNDFYMPRYGSERAQLEARKAISALVGKNVLIQFKNGNSSGAEQILQRYGNSLDSNYRSQLAGTVAQTKKAEYITTKAQEFFNENKNMSYDEVFERVKASGNNGSLDTAFNEWEGKTGDNKGVACAEMVCKIGNTWGNSFLREEAEKGVVWVPTMVADAKERGLLDTKNLVPQKGDVIVYGDNDHVVIADGKGGAVGNSTAEEKVKRYDDYKDIRGGDVTAIIRTGSLSGNTPLSDYDAKRQADEIYAEMNKLNSRQQHENNRYIQSAATAFSSYLLQKADAGEGITREEAKEFMAPYLTGNPEIDNQLLMKAYNASGGAKAGTAKASKEQSLLFKTNFKAMLKYMDSDEATEFIDQANADGRLTFSDYVACVNEITKKNEGKGDYKYNWTGIKNAVKRSYEGDKDRFDVDYLLAQERTQKEIDNYRVEHKTDPSPYWVEEKMQAALAGVKLDNSWFGDKTNSAELYGRGVYSFEGQTRYNPATGQYEKVDSNDWYDFTLNSGHTVRLTSEQVKDFMKSNMTIEEYLQKGLKK